MNTDKAWERFGKDDPYYGVLTHDRFSKSHLTPEHLDAFFKSGVTHVDEVMQTVRKQLDPSFAIRNALDFGCGVGRLLGPLAQVAREVTGVDVSTAMLKEAETHCAARSLHNVVLLKSDDRLTALDGKSFNFIHSFIVFQHIPISRGERIFRRLLTHLEDGGVGVVHFTYAYSASAWKKGAKWARSHIPLLHPVLNVISGKRFSYPHMQMNAYRPNRLFAILQDAAIPRCHVTFTDHGGMRGVVLYFMKGTV